MHLSDLQTFCRKGAFGSVYKQVLDGTGEVAVKHLSDTVAAASIRSFASEVSIMHGCRCASCQCMMLYSAKAGLDSHLWSISS